MKKNNIIKDFKAAIAGEKYVIFRHEQLQPLCVLDSSLYPLVCTDGRCILTFTPDGYYTDKPEEDIQDSIRIIDPMDWTPGTFFEIAGERFKIIEDLAAYADSPDNVPSYRYMCVCYEPQPPMYEYFTAAGIGDKGHVRI